MANDSAFAVPAAAAPPAVTVRPTVARVDTGVLARNLGVVKRRIGPTCRVLAVVKADGYGHG
ncbi:MAG: alanine racemase, partial [Deltaproteobacteria bacterium]|nr:alanine racemase [Nannocystaceae bacterium]